jgi:flavin reductase (DIM6/NTAB) family NADH-FMN oxidoreductase RutF
MKTEISTRPAAITEQWPGELDSFSWQDFVTAIPAPLFVMTGWKSNGKENACLQSWSTFVGEGGEFYCIIGNQNTNGHAYKSLKETGVCVLNFPSGDVYDRCCKTIENNDWETDEITASGLLAEKAVSVNAPRIAECFLNIECEFAWEHQLGANDGHATICLKARHVAMDDTRFSRDKLGRYGKTGYLYNINSPRNPVTGEAEPEAVGVIESL